MIHDYFMQGQCHAYAHALVEKNNGWKYAAVYVIDAETERIIDVPHVYAYDQANERLHDVTGDHDPDYATEIHDNGIDEGHLWVFETWDDLLDSLEIWGYATPDLETARREV